MTSMARAIKRNPKKAQLVGQSFNVKITPLVIYGLEGVHMHAHILWWNESDYKKPGARRLCGLKNYQLSNIYVPANLLSIYYSI